MSAENSVKMTNDYDLDFFDELHTVVFCMILIVPPSATVLSLEARVYGHGSWTCLAGFFAILHEEKSMVLTNPVNPPYKQLVSILPLSSAEDPVLS